MDEFKYILYKKSYEDPFEAYTLDSVPTSGFCSIYLFNEQLVEYFKANGTVKGFGDTKPDLYSDTLFFDFDDNKEAADKAVAFLKEQGIRFNEYESGGRSVHLHVHRTPVVSKHLAFSDREFVRKYFPGADLSIYKTVGVYRMTGTVHQTTGRLKSLVRSYEGRPAEPPITEPTYDVISSEGKSLFKDSFVLLSTVGFDNGSRNKNMYTLILKLKELGYDSQFTEQYIKAVNEVSRPPMSDTELANMINYHIYQGVA